jgi:hypothetical protein
MRAKGEKPSKKENTTLRFSALRPLFRRTAAFTAPITTTAPSPHRVTPPKKTDAAAPDAMPTPRHPPIYRNLFSAKSRKMSRAFLSSVRAPDNTKLLSLPSISSGLMVDFSLASWGLF